ncbi:LuxR C-terminal-related transcriptional regulator [Streptomyces sp. NRRL F-6492]|uniref:LuxR C-terminal-related transcriptional regulator n=1 Tax=Streptomyces sp. NRRL F-6492 TaxID=1519497 RepID=UPI0006B02258|nr:LuxR family transcriptional regulator [Streptomyces sp. NRRL F-6492]
MERRSFGTGSPSAGRGEEAAGGSGFVGRAEQARRLREALREGPGLTVVRGGAGTGTSRLVDEVLGRAEFAEWTQLRGTCPDTADPAPLGPVADALAGLPYRPVPAGRPLPAVTGAVGLLVPELADRLPHPPAPAADPEVRRGLLPRAVGALLATVGDAVLVVEDVHHADPATLALLHHLTGAMPAGLRLVVTEDTAAGLPVLGVRAPEGVRVEEIDVRPWTPGETGEFVRRWLDAHRPDRTHEREELTALVHELTGGLPSAAGELLRGAGELLRGYEEDGLHRRDATTEPWTGGTGGAAEPWTGRTGRVADSRADGAERAASPRADGACGVVSPRGGGDRAWTGRAERAASPRAGEGDRGVESWAGGAGRMVSPRGGGDRTAEFWAERVAGSVLDVVCAVGVPVRVRRELARRCAPLGEDARRIVEAAAVLGLAVPVGVLAEVADLAPGRAETAVEACVRRSVLRADGPCPDFRHPLDRRAALARLSGPRLARLSLRAARALRRGGEGPPPLADLARLYAAAGRVDEALRCLVTAADRAAAAGDYATATSLYTRAVAEDPRAGGRIRTAAKLARTAQLARAGEPVVAAVRRVLDEDDPPPRLRGEIRLHLSVVLRNQSGGALDSLNEVARAVPDLEASDPQTAARAMAVAAIPSIKGWPVDRHREWLERGEALADRVTDPVARAAIAANRATALMLLGDPRAWTAAEALGGPAGSAMEAAHHARGWTNLAHAASALGYGARAREFLDRAAAGLADTSSPYLEGLVQTARLVLAWHEGRWQGLHAAADRTTRLYREIPDLTSEAMLVRGLTALHVLGDVPRARHDLAEAARTTRYDTGLILTASAAATARVHLEAGRPGRACDAVEEVLHRLERTGGWVWAGEVLPVAVEALHGSGQTARARRLVADFADGTAGSDAPAARTALTVCRALLAEAGERPDEAVGLLADAEERWRLLGRPFDAARAAEARGRCLLGLRGEAAADGVQEVVEVYGRLDARWDVARCRRLLRRHDIVTTHRRGRLGYGDQLSPREQEVARLVVQGRANRDIAESLVLSPRTVEHHVARIMRKLNASSRTDIALAGWGEGGAEPFRGGPGRGVGPL